MILGAPNVGKSTLINSLCNRKAAKVENRPSVTRAVTWISCSTGYRIFDTPGILEPKISNDRNGYNLVLINAIKLENVELEEVALYALKFLPQKL